MNIHTVQLNIGDLLGGTSHMDATELGAYVSLFLACYQIKDHELPDQAPRLARMARCTPKVWGRVRDVVMEKFVRVDRDGVPKWTHNRVLEEAQSYRTKSAINSNNALKRWERDMQPASEPQSDGNATHNPKPNGLDSLPPNPQQVDEPDLNKNDSLGGLDGADAPLPDGTFLHEEFPQVFTAEQFADNLPRTWAAITDHFIVQDDTMPMRRIFALAFWEKWVGAYPGAKDDAPFARKKNWRMCWEHEAENSSRKAKGLGPRQTPLGMKKRWGGK